MIRSSLKYIRNNAIAFLALFVALSGTAIAAGLPKNSVGTKQIKKRAVTSVKVKNNTLTGKQINESKLGQVPSAASAGSAANADKLDGIDSSVLGSAVSVPGSVFAPRDMASGTVKVYAGTGAINAIGGTTDFHYAVHLPQGAKVTSLDYRFVDTEPGSDSSLTLYALNTNGAASTDSDSLVTAASSGSTAGRRSSSGAPASSVTIDNNKWSYVLVWSPFNTGSGTQLVGGRINYTLPTS